MGAGNRTWGLLPEQQVLLIAKTSLGLSNYFSALIDLLYIINYISVVPFKEETSRLGEIAQCLSAICEAQSAALDNGEEEIVSFHLMPPNYPLI